MYPKVVSFHYSQEYLPLQFWPLDQQDRLQHSWRQDWIWLTRDQVTSLLEHSLLQDLSWKENWPSDQVSSLSTSRLTLCTHWSLTRNTAPPPWGVTRGRPSLIGSQSSLQFNCNKDGFNVVGTSSYYSKARIGIISNNQNDCSSCDSRIDFGTEGLPDDSSTCGNEAQFSTDNGDKKIKAMGYILVQWKLKLSIICTTVDIIESNDLLSVTLVSHVWPVVF